MAITYAENPDNFCDIEAFVETDIKQIKRTFFSAGKFFSMIHVLFKDILIWQTTKRVS